MTCKDIYNLELCQPLFFSSAEPFLQFCRGYEEEQFCEIILNLDQWFRRRCHLNDSVCEVLAALMFGGADSFVRF